MLDTILSVLAPVNRAGWPFVGAAAVVTLVLAWLWPPFLVPGLILTLYCAYFFRDPERFVPARDSLVVSPADGKVQTVAPAVPPAELELGSDPLMRVSIFLNIFNVHINRVPVSGRVTALSYRPGKFLNAHLDKASELNERQSIRLAMADGRNVGVVQIAGLVARRIICDLRLGQQVARGERFGMIRFGSRLDVYLPNGVAPLVAVGQTMVGGETVIADLAGAEAKRNARPC